VSEVTEFPVLKILTADEAIAVSQRLGAKRGVIMYDCPCGCGKIDTIYIGEPNVRDLLFYAKNLENYAMVEYCEDIEQSNEIS